MITALSVNDLAIARGDRLLFSGFGLEARAGEAIALTGRNGAGKTSLLRAIAGLIRPHAGTIGFAGPADADDARALHLHLLGHHDGLKPGRTAWDELLFQARWTGGTETTARAACARLDLDRLRDLEVRKLSAGQRRRVALARLLAAPRALWLLDEPLAPLDSDRRADFGGVMTEHLAGGGLIIAAVHDPLPIDARTVEIAP
jgi:heme exporter protein A